MGVASTQADSARTEMLPPVNMIIIFVIVRKVYIYSKEQGMDTNVEGLAIYH